MFWAVFGQFCATVIAHYYAYDRSPVAWKRGQWPCRWWLDERSDSSLIHSFISTTQAVYRDCEWLCSIGRKATMVHMYNCPCKHAQGSQRLINLRTAARTEIHINTTHKK